MLTRYEIMLKVSEIMNIRYTFTISSPIRVQLMTIKTHLLYC